MQGDTVYVFRNKKDKDRILKIVYDEDSQEDPRKFDGNNGIMVCCHNHYKLGDKQFDDPQQIDELIKEEKPFVILPLYLYDHSGITMSTKDFGDQWDSGQVGFIYTTKQKLKENGHVKITKEFATKLLQNEVDVYDDYIKGDVYGFIGSIDKNGIFDDHYKRYEWENIE